MCSSKVTYLKCIIKIHVTFLNLKSRHNLPVYECISSRLYAVYGVNKQRKRISGTEKWQVKDLEFTGGWGGGVYPGYDKKIPR